MSVRHASSYTYHDHLPPTPCLRVHGSITLSVPHHTQHALQMGNFLDQPITDKHTLDGEANGMRYAVSSMQGWRVGMEVRGSVCRCMWVCVSLSVCCMSVSLWTSVINFSVHCKNLLCTVSPTDHFLLGRAHCSGHHPRASRHHLLRCV